MTSDLPKYDQEYPSRFEKGTLGYVLDQERGIEATCNQRKCRIVEEFTRGPKMKLRIYETGGEDNAILCDACGWGRIAIDTADDDAAKCDECGISYADEHRALTDRLNQVEAAFKTLGIMISECQSLAGRIDIANRANATRK